MVYITYCYKITENHIKELKRLLKKSPMVFGAKFRGNLDLYDEYIHQEFSGATLHHVDDDKLEEYIKNVDIPKNTRNLTYTRIVEIDIFGNIQSTIKTLN